VKCISPELWEEDSTRNILIGEFVQKIKKLFESNKVDGITITGGDPLEQKDEFLSLLGLLHPICQDILVYTGYTMSELHKLWHESEIKLLEEYVGVLIDDRYIHELNDNCCPLRGSLNQEIYYFDETLKDIYEKYCTENGRKIQTLHYGSGAISVGIHNRER
jgi:anaerobic ribonucleoside-triphosphate reductase activating protein